jgi:hypothetical protein
MDTFSSDYISSNSMGITANVVKGMPRAIAVPIKKPKFTSKSKKQIKEISECIKKLAEAISKVS